MLKLNGLSQTTVAVLLLTVLSGTFKAACAAPASRATPSLDTPTCGNVHGEEEFVLHGEKISAGPVRCRVRKLEPKTRLDITRLARVEGVTQVCTVLLEQRQMRAPGGGDPVVEFGYVRDDGPMSMLGCRWSCHYKTGFKCVKPARVQPGSECECEKQPPIAILERV